MISQTLRLLIKDQRNIPLGVKLIVLVIFLRSVGWGFSDPFFSMYLQQFEAPYVLIGFFIAFIQIGALVSLIPLIRLADRMRDTTLIHDGEVLYLFSVIFFIVAGFSKSLLLLLLSLFLVGMAYTFTAVGAESYIRKHDADGQARPFGFYVALDYFGWILGMVLGAFIINYTGLNWMFLWIFPSIVAGLFILPRIHERGVRSFLRGFKKYFSSSEGYFAALSSDFKQVDHKVVFVLVLCFFYGAIRMFSYTFIPLFGLYIGLPLTSIALMLAVVYLPFVFSFFLSEVTDHFKRMNVIAAGLFIGAVAYLLLYFIVHQGLVILLAAITSFSRAIVRPVYNGAITRLTPRRMLGEMTGLNNFTDRLGRIVGPIALGFVADSFGLQVSFLFVAVTALLLGMASLAFHGYNYLVTDKVELVISE
ncbi:MAG: MFS transporter [Candidatus Peregrinibacteria bacterium]